MKCLTQFNRSKRVESNKSKEDGKTIDEEKKIKRRDGENVILCRD